MKGAAGGELRPLSSAQTPFVKIFAVVWLTGFGIGTLAILFGGIRDNHGLPPSAGIKVLFPAAWAAAFLLMRFFAFNLKRVRISGRTLFVSDYFQEIEIPISEIAAVGENRWLNGRPITLYLRSPTAFGQQITFMPKICFSFFMSSHPIADELRALINPTAGG